MSWWLAIPALGLTQAAQLEQNGDIPHFVRRPGFGTPIRIGDRVTLHFAAETPDGKWLASSWRRGFPYTFSVGDATGDRLLQRCVLQMLEGEESKFVCPASIAYGDLNIPPILAAGTDLVLTIRVVSVVRTVATVIPDSKPGRR